jgi:cytochrome P450
LVNYQSFPFFQYISTLKWNKVVRAEDAIYGYAQKLIDEGILRFRDHLECGTLTNDKFHLLSYLISRDSLSLKDVTVLCLSMLLDGLSTTSPTVLFCLYCLSIDSRVQQKVYNEIVQVVGQDPGVPVTADHINKMPYLKAFIKETFRYT